MDHVGQREDLVQIFGDQQHRRAAVAGRQQLAVHIGHRADIEAAHRLVGQDDLRVASSTRPRISFCMLPPDSSRMRVSAPGSARRSRR